MFFGLTDPEPLVRGTDLAPESRSFPFLINVLSGRKKCLQNNILTLI
jgi:hypothetical protein